MPTRLFSSSLGGGGSVSFPIQINQGGTGQTTQTLGFNALSPQTTKGDLIVFDGTNAVREPVGTNGQLLSANSAETSGVEWIDPPASSPLTTKGDIYTYASANARLPVGSDYQFLRALASATNGIEWFSPYTETDDGNSGTSKTIDFSAQKLAHKLTLTGNVTLTFTAPSQVGTPIVLAIYTGAGSFTVTYPSTVKWSGGLTPTSTVTASRMDLVNAYYAADGNYYATIAQNFTP